MLQANIIENEIEQVSVMTRGITITKREATKRFLYTVTLSDTFKGIAYGLYYSKNHLFHSYVVIPVGILVSFTILYGLNQLLTKVIKIKFPCSVLGMLINLVFLCVLSVLSNLEVNRSSKNGLKSKVSKWSSWILTHYLTLIKPSMNFTLKWINVFFIPSFIILPLSDPITFIECLKIAGVFIGGFLLLFCVDVYVILSLKWVLKRFGYLTNDDINDHHQKDGSDSEEIELQDMPNKKDQVFTSMRDDITTIDLTSLRSVKTEQSQRMIRTLSINENPFNTQESSINDQRKSIPLPSIQEPEPSYHKSNEPSIYKPKSSNAVISVMRDSEDNDDQISTSPISSSASSSNISNQIIFDNLTENSKKITKFITNYIDWLLYLILFVVSIPFYYIQSIHAFLPYHLGLTILSYYTALLIPQKWPRAKKFAHPILISTGKILFVCFIGSLIYHGGNPKGFLDDLKYYKTGKNYLNLFNNKTLLNNGKITEPLSSDYSSTPKWPGCGDVLSSLMDISIVALSLPMFSYRRDFVANFWVLAPPILISICLTFFIYPILCFHLGINPERSIGFIGRSVTLALGTPLITALEGSVSLMAVCTILSGICGVLVGDTLFSFLRISKNDYVTRGVSLGINCGAIATAHLLNVDPRAASMSSLSFSLFGTVMVIMASIGAVGELIRSWVGL